VVRNGDRIIGGDLATTGQFKYQVALLIDGSGFCGGSLIANDVVLTAGHCVIGYAETPPKSKHY
jgi:secreted trypsin-like serine protease